MMAQHDDAFGHPLSVGDEVYYIHNEMGGRMVFCLGQVVDLLPKMARITINEYRHKGVHIEHEAGLTDVDDLKSVPPHSLIRR